MTATNTTLRNLNLTPRPPRRLRPLTSLGDLGRYLGARLSGRRGAFLAVVALTVLAAIVHAWGMASAPGWVDDEGTYVAQAWAVNKGVGLAHYTYWYDHPPLGWLQLAVWNALTGAFSGDIPAVAVGRAAMLVAKVASCLLLYALARRLRFSRLAGLGAVALFAFSPLAIGFQRMVYLDNLATPWLLAAFVLALSPERRTSAAIASGLCFGVAVLSKETVLLLLPALAYQTWRHAQPATRRLVMWMMFFASTAVIVGYPLLALLKGELLPGNGHVSLIGSALWQVLEREGSGSLLDAGSPVRGMVDSWIGMDPFLVWATVVALPLTMCVARLRPIGLVLIIQVLVLARGGYIPHPFPIGLFPFAALALAGLGDVVLERPVRTRPASSRRRLGLSRLTVGHVTWATSLVAVVTLAVGAVIPRWGSAYAQELTPEGETPMLAASNWVQDRIDRDATLVVDDSIWVDLVEAGFDQEHVIWFYKLDLDPEVSARVTDWRSIDYLVLGDMKGETLAGLPRVSEVLGHSRPIASFGEGPSGVTVFRTERNTDR